MIRTLLPLLLLAGPAMAGPVEFNFIGRLAVIGAVYLAYLAAIVLAIVAWRRGQRVLAIGLAAVWVVCAALIPLIDYMRARQQAEAAWALRLMPERLPLDGKVFLSDDTVRTPDSAINMFSDPSGLFGLYYRKDTAQALAAGPVDFADLRYYEHIHDPGIYKSRRVREVPAGTRITPDYLMLARLWGDERPVLDRIRLPDGGTVPPDVFVRLAIVEVDDPAAFDLEKARLVLLWPGASASYHPPPYNPWVRNVYSAATYTDEMALMMRLFCADVPEDLRDRCRREI